MQKRSSLFTQSAIGVFWLSGSQVISQLLHMTIRLMLASLLAPADFGLMAMAMLLINFTNWFIDMGLGAALVQRKEITEAHKSTAFWANLLMGLAVFACLLLTAPVVARFFQTDTLLPIIICLSFGILCIAPRSTLENLLMREGKFQTIASREIWSIVCGGATGLTLAWFGYGIWALVAQSLIDNFADTAFLFWRSTWRPKWVFERNAFLDLWQFSKPLIGARLFTYFNRNVDTILIGRFLGAAPLGFYNLGYQFVLLPLTYVTRPFSKVLFTTLSRVQHDEIRLRNGYLQSIQLLSFVIFPLMTLIALEVPDLIGLLLGEKWQPASALIPYFCFVGLIQSVLNVMPAVFQATGHTNLILRWNFTTVMVNILAFSIGLAWGIQGVAIAYTLGTLVLAPFLQNALLRALHLPWALFGHALLKPILISLMMVGVWAMSGWGMAAIDLNASPFVGDILQSSVAIAAYLAISWYWNQTFKNTLGRLRIGHRIKCYQQKLSIS